jgi:Transposase family tnp2
MLPSIVIPGPKKPKDINSFLRPLVDELITLDNGDITAVDGDTGEEFTLLMC